MTKTIHDRIRDRHYKVVERWYRMHFSHETDEEFLDRIKKTNIASLNNGVERGWWDAVIDGRPIKFLRATLSDGPTMAHAMAKLKVFPSIGVAKKNGWDVPIEKGEWKVGKKIIKIE